MKAENDPKSLASITSRFIYKPFKWGGRGDGGYDCTGLVCEVQKAMGKNLEGRISNYPFFFSDDDCFTNSDLFYNDKDLMIKKMTEMYSEIGNEVNSNYKVAGDILLMSAGEKSLFGGIYLGNGNVITALYDRGTRVMALKPHIKIIMARRLV